MLVLAAGHQRGVSKMPENEPGRNYSHCDFTLSFEQCYKTSGHFQSPYPDPHLCPEGRHIYENFSSHFIKTNLSYRTSGLQK